MSDPRDRHSALNARDDLLAIADAWPDLLDRLGREGRTGGEKVSGSHTPGLVINEAVSEVMRELTSWAFFLARVLMEEVDDWRPASSAPDDLLRQIARERIGHFTEHPDDGMRMTFGDEARDMRHLAERTAYPSGRRHIPLNIACTEHATSTLGERVECPGAYTVLLDPERPGLVPDMVCSQDPQHRITPDEWQRASRRSALDPTATRALLARIKGA